MTNDTSREERDPPERWRAGIPGCVICDGVGEIEYRGEIIRCIRCRNRLAALRSPSPSLEREALEKALRDIASGDYGATGCMRIAERALAGEESAPREVPKCTDPWHSSTFFWDGMDECPDCGDHCRPSTPPVPELRTIRYPITPDTVDEFNALVAHEGWAICTMEVAPGEEHIFEPDSGSTFSRYQLEALWDDDGPILFSEDWDDVVDFVARRANEGSQPHQEALKFFETYTPKEWGFIQKIIVLHGLGEKEEEVDDGSL